MGSAAGALFDFLGPTVQAGGRHRAAQRGWRLLAERAYVSGLFRHCLRRRLVAGASGRGAPWASPWLRGWSCACGS